MLPHLTFSKRSHPATSSHRSVELQRGARTAPTDALGLPVALRGAAVTNAGSLLELAAALCTSEAGLRAESGADKAGHLVPAALAAWVTALASAVAETAAAATDRVAVANATAATEAAAVHLCCHDVGIDDPDTLGGAVTEAYAEVALANASSTDPSKGGSLGGSRRRVLVRMFGDGSVRANTEVTAYVTVLKVRVGALFISVGTGLDFSSLQPSLQRERNRDDRRYLLGRHTPDELHVCDSGGCRGPPGSH
jgi:hypothetical protein